MRHAFIISRSGSSVRSELLNDLEALGCFDPHVSEVDLRDKSASDLFMSGIISQGAYLAMMHGRSSDYEIPSSACVGCYLSHLAMCRRIALLPQGHLALVVEADCKLDVPLMNYSIESIENETTLSKNNPHLVIFGGIPVQGCTPGVSDLCGAPNNFTDLPIPGADTVLKPVLAGSIINKTHCCLYTISGAAFILDMFDDGRRPVDVQFDYALSMLAVRSPAKQIIGKEDDLSFLWWCPKGSWQSLHLSSIQRMCLTCRMKGAGAVVVFVGIIFFVFLLGVIIAYRYHNPRSCG